MARPKKKTGRLPKASIENLKRPFPVAQKQDKKVVPFAPGVTFAKVSQITSDPYGKIFGLAEDGRVYIWNFAQGVWALAIQAQALSARSDAESDLDKPQRPAPAEARPEGLATPPEDPLG